MTCSDTSLALVACALGSPGLQVLRAASAGRWRGSMGEATVLKVHPDASHRVARLQVLRRVLDLQADGRWSLRVQATDASGLVGPLQTRLDQVLRLQACLLTWPHPVLLRRLFFWVDGMRVDQRVLSLFPGAARDLALDPASAWPRELAALVRDRAPPADATEALRVALALHQHVLAARLIRQPGLSGLARPDLGTPAHMSSPAMHGDPHHSQNGFQEAVWVADARRAGAVAGTLQIDKPSFNEEAVSANTSNPAAAPQSDGGPVPVRQSSARPSAPGRARRITHHDEWDYHQQAHLKHWVSVHERDIQGTDLNFRADVLARFPSLSSQIRQHLVRLSADAPRRQRRLRDGDGVDLDAALEAFVDRRQGQQHADDKLYEARPHQERDVSVALLLDTSGSTGYGLPEGKHAEQLSADAEPFESDDLLWQPGASRVTARSAPRRRVIDVVKDAATLLCEALHALGDSHAVFAFSGQGRDRVEFDVVKRFDQVWSAQTAAAMAALRPTGATRTGAAVRHALQLMRTEPARRKILIVISDGYPQDNDYGPDPADLQYGLLDTAHALREAERAGVSTFNISVDAAANDYLRRICPGNRYWVVDDVDALPTRMLALFRRMAVSGA